jgi:hypothetical protein
MLKSAVEFDSKTTMRLLLKGWLAWDQERKIHLTRSDRIDGWYALMYDDYRDFPNGPGGSWCIEFAAPTDPEAIKQANEELQKLGVLS